MLDTLLSGIRYVPSSMGADCIEILVVGSEKVKARIAQFKRAWCPPTKKAYPADFLAEVPVILIVCADTKRSYERHLENGIIASTYILLAATALGLGTTFLTAYNMRKPAQVHELKRILKIPARLTPITIIPVGYPSDTQTPKKVRALHEVVHYGSF